MYCFFGKENGEFFSKYKCINKRKPWRFFEILLAARHNNIKAMSDTQISLFEISPSTIQIVFSAIRREKKIFFILWPTHHIIVGLFAEKFFLLLLCRIEDIARWERQWKIFNKENPERMRNEAALNYGGIVCSQEQKSV